MSHSVSRKALIFLRRVESLIAQNAPAGVQHSFVIHDVHPHECDAVVDIICNEHQDDTGFYLTKEPKYDKHSFELTVYGMFEDDTVYDEDEC